MTQWDPDLSIEPPDWLRVGTSIVHTTFGSGRVGRVGHHRDVPTVWIDFDAVGIKALSLEFGLAHLSPTDAD